MPDPSQGDKAEAAEQAAQRYEDYKTRAEGEKPSSDEQLRVLKRDADRAKLALHRNRVDD